jgi:hypothetical protein
MNERSDYTSCHVRDDRLVIEWFHGQPICGAVGVDLWKVIEALNNRERNEKKNHRVRLFDRGDHCTRHFRRWIVEDPDGGDPEVGVFGELVDECYVPPVIPRRWIEEVPWERNS